jgi:hypothetical protein
MGYSAEQHDDILNAILWSEGLDRGLLSFHVRVGQYEAEIKRYIDPASNRPGEYLYTTRHFVSGLELNSGSAQDFPTCLRLAEVSLDVCCAADDPKRVA